jgi:hypothetical protein
MATQLLAITDLKDFEPYTLEGLQAQRVRPQLDGALEACLGPDGPSILATCADLSGKGILEWRTGLPGTPVNRSDLGSEDMFRLDGMLSEAAASMQAEAARLLPSEDQEERVTGGLLRNTASSIEILVSGGEGGMQAFLVGDRPVLAGWGLRPVTGNKGDSEEPALAPTDALAVAFAADDGAGNAHLGGSPAAAASVAGGQGPWNLLRTALTALVTFLALSILLFLFFPGLRDYLSGSDFRYDPSEERRLQAELFGLREDYFEDLSSCAKPEVREAELRLEPLPKTELEFEDAPEETQDILSVKTPEPEPPPKPDPPPEPAPVPKPEPKPKPKEPSKPRAGQDLVIPADGDPKDASFLEGCWEYDAGLVNLQGVRFLYVYCFNASGKGTSTIKEYNKAGKQINTCRGPASVTRRGTSITIRDTRLNCDNRTHYIGANLTCSRTPSGGSACKGNSGVIKAKLATLRYIGRG